MLIKREPYCVETSTRLAKVCPTRRSHPGPECGRSHRGVQWLGRWRHQARIKSVFGASPLRRAQSDDKHDASSDDKHNASSNHHHDRPADEHDLVSGFDDLVHHKPR